ncbi:cellulase-like protein 7 [Elsinoe australis]|uniref:Cellulase-like protein 7 n=1 Tax=Elsinoe australis TaxID=40998 RepID=A0A4U7AT67_9PEZI|nr:cellulase-like protein 7 [Elsinoe australis]
MYWLQLAALFAGAATAAPARRQARCADPFTRITAQQWVDSMNPGWNLGNSLDALPTEGSWNNPPVDFKTFDDVKAKGFKGIRLPVTWNDHFISDSPTHEVDPVWMDRVEAVVDAALERDFYAVVNVHHDSWNWADLTKAGANYTYIEERFERLWTQIATRFACKSERLSFETINEPPGTTQQHYTELTKLQDIFLNVVRETGGHNQDRVLNLVGPQQSGVLTPGNFVRPTNITNPWLIQYHYYSPYDFIFSAWGKTIWGSDADKQALENDIASMRNNFTDVPLIIGEWAASPAATESAARRKYNDFFIRTAAKYNTPTVLWDNGADYLDRAAATWRDDTAVEIILQGQAGASNSLGDSTTDTAATTQQSSAYVFHKLGDAVTDQALPFLFNGNTLTGIKSSSGPLTEGADYSVSAEDITFTSAFLGRVLTNSTGVATSLTLSFSAGADYQVSVVQWETPTLAASESPISAINGTSLNIPITWKGVAQLATVRASTASGGYLSDDFTQYFGPLADHRITYNGQWNFDANNVIIAQNAITAVKTLGQAVTFEFEFYPRVPGNSANYTITV